MEGKTFYLTIRGQRVEVSEEVYRAYIRPVRKERKRQYRAIGKYSVYSWERMKDNGVEIVDTEQDVEEKLVQSEDEAGEKQAIIKAFSQLKPKYKLVLTLQCLEDKTQNEIAELLGITQQNVSYLLKAATACLEKNFKEFL